MEDNGVFTSYLSLSLYIYIYTYIYICVCVGGGATTFHCTYLQHAMLLKVFLYLTQSCHATLVDAQEAEIEFFQVKHAPWNFHGMLEDTMVRL